MPLKIFIFNKNAQYIFLYINIYNNTFSFLRKLYMIINNLIINRLIKIKLQNHLPEKDKKFN